MAREAFEQFWAEYPKRPNNPKHPAWLEWERLVKAKALPAQSEMMRAVRSYASLMRAEKIEPKYIAHARTWLHQRRWEEFLEAAESVKAEAPQVPSIFGTVKNATFLNWWRSIAFGLEIVDEAEHVVIRTKDRYRMSQLETDANVIARVIGRDVRVECRP